MSTGDKIELGLKLYILFTLGLLIYGIYLQGFC